LLGAKAAAMGSARRARAESFMIVQISKGYMNVTVTCGARARQISIDWLKI
jgi:hypothetical protein